MILEAKGGKRGGMMTVKAKPSGNNIIKESEEKLRRKKSEALEMR